MSVLIIRADARALPIADECVQCVVTSPPYWGLRRYAGDQGAEPYGLEPKIEMYVQHTVQILREIRRVLRRDGVVFWNVGDSYSGSWANYGGGARGAGKQRPIIKGSGAQNPVWEGLEGYRPPTSYPQKDLKRKDLCLIPSRVALAAQVDGWWVRSLIIWAKPNPMPESVTDRPTDAYEHIIMLTESERYYWDADAVRENLTQSSIDRLMQDVDAQEGSARVPGKTNGNMKAVARGGWNGSKFTDQRDVETKPNLGMGERKEIPGRNMRNVWTFPTQPYAGAHFATFPEEIPRRCIKAASRPGDLILDPFGGSGTTARVAVELNRRAISVDLAYHDHAEARMRNVQRDLLETVP